MTFLNSKYFLSIKTFNLIIALSLFLLNSKALSLPQFSRRYNVSCNMCHAGVPRLNAIGYKFRAAGFRMPDEIGKEMKLDFDQLNSVRAELAAYINGTKNKSTDESQTLTQTQFKRVVIHPLTGTFGSHIGTAAELAFPGGDKVEIEQTHIRYAFGNEDLFGSFRVGVFHAFDGFSSADRPIGISRPLIQTSESFRGNTETLFSVAEPSTAGFSVAYLIKNTNLSLSFLNRSGVEVSGDEAELNYQSDESRRLSDLLFTSTSIFDETGPGSALTLYYYHGQSVIPINTNTYITSGSGPTYANNFNRIAVYANYFINERWSLIAGGGLGKDQLPNNGGDLNSSGYFVGAESYISNRSLAGGIRFDEFNGDRDNNESKTNSGTAYINWMPSDQLRLVVELQQLTNGRSVPNSVEQFQMTTDVTFMF